MLHHHPKAEITLIMKLVLGNGKLGAKNAHEEGGVSRLGAQEKGSQKE